ncbi:MAG: hypothetical protein J6P74_01455 [Paludibacteraceae bacterium]|nr:hypothetical protein [Paludibacteraceae bacterium]
MSSKRFVDSIKREMQSIENYVSSYENVLLPSGRRCIIKINTFQTKLGFLIDTCLEMSVEHPDLFPVAICNELINIKNEDVSIARYEIHDDESEYHKIISIWGDVKHLIDPVINNL